MRLRVSELAARTGVPASTLRYYDRVGLLPSSRTPSGYRSYDADDLRRLEFITAAKRLGLPLRDIVDLAEVWQSGTCARVRADLRPRLQATIAATRVRRVEVENLLETLEREAAHLAALPDRSTSCDPSCSFLRDGSVEEPLGPEGGAAAAPIACSLSDPATVRERSTRWHEALAGAWCEVVDRGLRWRLTPDGRVGSLAELAAAEVVCCPFLDIALEFLPGAVQITVRAPQEAQDLLTEVFPGPSSGVSTASGGTGAGEVTR